VELRRSWASLLAAVVELAAAGLCLGGARPWQRGLPGPDLGPSGPDLGRPPVEVVLVRWGSAGAVLQLVVGSREARQRPSISRAGSGPLGPIWVRGASTETPGYSLQRHRHGLAAFCRLVRLVFGLGWLGLSAGTGARRKDRQRLGAGWGEAPTGRRLLSMRRCWLLSGGMFGCWFRVAP
jgi:hypothetical protein